MRTGIGRLIIPGIFVLAMFPVVRGHGGSFETRCVDVAPGYSKTSVNTTRKKPTMISVLEVKFGISAKCRAQYLDLLKLSMYAKLP